MCGIAGFWDDSGAFTADRMRDTLKDMTDWLAHRGPDDEGAYIGDEAGIAIGHRRLSIVDISPLGHQPMVSASGRFVLA